MNHQLPPSLVNAFKTQTVLSGSGEVLPLDSNVSIAEATALLTCVAETHATTSAEVGLAKGISSTAICAGIASNGGGTHHIMDPFQEQYGNAGLRMLRDSGLDEIMRFYPNFAEEIFPTLPSLDFVFIDASHLFDYTLLEFILADKKLKCGGIIAFHDLWMPSLRKLIRYILRNRSYVIEERFSAMASNPNAVTKAIRPKVFAAQLIAPVLRTLPKSKTVFTDEMLNPWHQFGLDNMVFLKKQSEDTRDWRHFRPF